MIRQGTRARFCSTDGPHPAMFGDDGAPRVQRGVNTKDSVGRTALHHAAHRGLVAVAFAILSSKRIFAFFFLDILLKLNPVLKGQLFGSLTPRHATTKCVNDETDNRFPCIAMCMLLIGGWVDDGHALC